MVKFLLPLKRVFSTFAFFDYFSFACNLRFLTEAKATRCSQGATIFDIIFCAVPAVR
jgi:hypothetical protein